MRRSTALREALNKLDIDGTVVIGEGERDEAPMLFIGEKVGTKKGPKVDIALDPLEGTDLTAKGMGNALAVVAMATAGTMLHAPDTYMDKIAIGPGYPDGVVDLDASVEENIKELAKAKRVQPSDITLCVLDRDRHEHIVEGARRMGSRIILIPDGDVAGVFIRPIPRPASTSMSVRAARRKAFSPRRRSDASAGRCREGSSFAMTTKRRRAARAGIKDLSRKYGLMDLCGGDVFFAATGVTNGTMLEGVKWEPGHVSTHTVVMRSKTGTIRYIRARTRR